MTFYRFGRKGKLYMNILNIMHAMKIGGIEKLLVTVSNEMAKNNNVFLCIISNVYSDELLKKLSPKVKVIFLKRCKYFRRMNYLVQLSKLIAEHNIDIIHMHQPRNLLYYTPILTGYHNVKKIITIHDTGKMRKIGTVNRFIIRNVFDEVIAISNAVKEEIVLYKIPESKVHTVYNAIELNEFQLRKRNKNIGDYILIGNVARILPSKKGQDILIKAVSILNSKGMNVACKFAGDEVKQGDIKKLQDLADRLNVNKQIEFMGNVNDISSFLNSIDIFVLPSRYEGFGISLIEAMATGIPCISSDAPGVNEIITDDCYGLKFRSGDEFDLAEKITYMLTHLEQFDSKLIRSYIHDNYSVESMCKNLLNIYGGRSISNE